MQALSNILVHGSEICIGVSYGGEGVGIPPAVSSSTTSLLVPSKLPLSIKLADSLTRQEVVGGASHLAVVGGAILSPGRKLWVEQTERPSPAFNLLCPQFPVTVREWSNSSHIQLSFPHSLLLTEDSISPRHKVYIGPKSLATLLAPIAGEWQGEWPSLEIRLPRRLMILNSIACSVSFSVEQSVHSAVVKLKCMYW